MNISNRFGSIFSGDVDRAIFITYFLGTVTPLLALAWMANRYAMPSLARTPYGEAGVVMLILGIGALSLLSFIALRRLTQDAINGGQPRTTAPAEAVWVADTKHYGEPATGHGPQD